MSEYHAQTTVFKDQECLVKALIDCGYSEKDIEIHEQPQQLFDYVGRKTTYLDKTGDKANVIIRRNKIGYGSANDLGFRFNTVTGTYEAIVSEFDSGTHHWGANSDRMKKLKSGYAEHNLIKTAKKQGFKYLGKKVVNGKLQIQWLDARK